MNVETPAHSLKEEIALTAELISILKQEQAQLIAADINGLIAVTEEKSRVVVRISELTAQRYRALAIAGFDAKEGGMKAWLNGIEENGAAESSWRELLKLAQAVKTINSTNGLLISKHMTHNQQALNVLRGNPGSNFYGPNGQATSTLRPRGLVVG